MIKLYNSLSKKVEEFAPQDPNMVTMYLCGPTVYDYVTIGNFRTYTLGDIVHRVLKFNAYKVRYIMNLTDVGHLTGDNEGDADKGVDRLEKAAEREGKSARAISDFYIADFKRGYKKLNFLDPTKFTRATDYIKEQVSLVETLEKKGFTYHLRDGIYFNTEKFAKYGELSGMTVEGIREGARVEPNPEKKHPADFALWKFSPKDQKRWQEWDSPWGKGFPGWHVECSAMSLTEIGETVDIHLGGEDLKMIHHQNEIAQSECATGKQFVKFWMHGAFLIVDGGKMGKSLGNSYTLSDIESKGFDPLALRYFYFTAHYRTKLNFTWEALQSAQTSLKRLYDIVGSYEEGGIGSVPDSKFMNLFIDAINEDFSMPKALAVVWDMLKSDIPEPIKVRTLLKFDTVLGLNIEDQIGYEIPEKLLSLARVRQEYRKSGIWDKADLVRREIEELGFLIEDRPNNNYKLKRKV